MKKLGVLAAVVICLWASFFSVQAGPEKAPEAGTLSEIFPGREGAGILLWVVVVAIVAVIGILASIYQGKKQN